MRYSSSAMRTTTLLLLALLSYSPLATFAAEKMTVPQLINLAQSHSPALSEAITSTFTLDELKEGTA